MTATRATRTFKFTLMLTEDEVEELRALAQASGVSRADVIRNLFRDAAIRAGVSRDAAAAKREPRGAT